MLLAAIGRVHFDHLQILHIVDVDYPQPFLESLPRVFRVNERPAFARWLSTRSAVVLDTNLTQIEKQLLGLLAAGRTNAGIAKLRGKSPDTIRNQLCKLFDKLNVGSRAEAVSLLLASKTLSDIRID